MTIYLGKTKIRDLNLGSLKISEVYLGSQKIYPEDVLLNTIDFKIIFTDAEGNIYDQLAFRNIDTQQISSLNFRSTDLLNLNDNRFTNFGIINNNSITLNKQEFYQSINLNAGQYLVYIDENDNRFISISYDTNRLNELVLGNIIYETETDIKHIYGDGYDVYWEWDGFNINSGYELVGRKNGTGEVITICSDGDESKVSLNKSTIQNNIIRIYLDFNGTVISEPDPEPGNKFLKVQFLMPSGESVGFGTVNNNQIQPISGLCISNDYKSSVGNQYMSLYGRGDTASGTGDYPYTCAERMYQLTSLDGRWDSDNSFGTTIDEAILNKGNYMSFLGTASNEYGFCYPIYLPDLRDNGVLSSQNLAIANSYKMTDWHICFASFNENTNYNPSRWNYMAIKEQYEIGQTIKSVTYDNSTGLITIQFA